MQRTTGLSTEQFSGIVELIHTHHPELAITARSRGMNTAVGFFRRVHITVAYLRTNLTQAALAEFFATSQSTISRVVTTFTPAVAEVLSELVPTGDDLDPAEQLIIDGTLLPCWSWQDRPELYSGKHRATGVNVQVAATHHGALVWVSDPVPGRVHDSTALRATHILETLPDDAPFSYIGDKGYLGLGMLTPTRKPPLGSLTDQQKVNNKAINKTRSVVEHAIAHLKTWRILHTDYRRPYDTFPTTITAVLGLQFYRTNEITL